MVSRKLGVSKSTVGKWIRNNHIPNLDKAEIVAKASGFDVSRLRPRFEQ
ncbi:Helix-turn-helix protein [Herbaspirillum sp. YR522]|nr:Helix-turn-helix protein [Herbaspirillum sp. YR522]